MQATGEKVFLPADHQRLLTTTASPRHAVPNPAGAAPSSGAGHMASGAFEPAKLRASQLTRIDPDRYEYREVELGVLERSGADFQAPSANRLGNRIAELPRVVQFGGGHAQQG